MLLARTGGPDAGSAAATPPPATYADASATATCTASETSAPWASARLAAAANRSPAPQVSPSAQPGVGTTSGVDPAWQSSAPSPPSVTATAPARQRRRSPWAPRDAVASREAPGSAGTSSRTSDSFGVARCTPGTAAGPRGCGSHTTGARVAANASRSAGCRATPRP